MKVLEYLLVGIILIMTCGWSIARGTHKEVWYQNQWALEHNAITSVTLPDRTEVDIVWQDYTIEVEFAYKWAEAIGQALYYAAKTGKHAGILVIAGKDDDRYIQRIRDAIEYHKLDITIWEIAKQ